MFSSLFDVDFAHMNHVVESPLVAHFEHTEWSGWAVPIKILHIMRTKVSQ